MSAFALSDDAKASSQMLYVTRRGRGGGFEARIRGHILDLADPDSGHSLAPTPNDLFIASIASDIAWSARNFLRTFDLPDDVSVSAEWRTREGLRSPAALDLTITVSRPAQAVGAALGAALEQSLAARSLTQAVVRVSLDETDR
jgi:hypothetical protein